MYTTGYILFSSTGKYDITLIPLAFDTDKSKLEKKMEDLEKRDNLLQDRFVAQNDNIEDYISKFEIEWNKAREKIHQDSTLPFLFKKPQTREEHKEHKEIKDFNLEITRSNRNRIDSARRNFLTEWMNLNPPDSDFQIFVGVTDDFTLVKVLPDYCSCEYFISEMNKPAQEEY